ncbi:MAG: hypothetical protein JXR76_13130 [Deltaproteobacteria bacterium]|nr:hypothetical protein [Deltaproteobacteria bacterium]
MRRIPTKALVTAIFLIFSTVGARQVVAKELDLAIARFIECTADGTDCRAHNDAYERFMQEYAFGISPKLMSPASTLGYSGFYLGLESSVTPLPSSGTSSFNAATGNYNQARWRVGTAEYNSTPSGSFFPTIHVRKGLPWSFELGSSISYLAKSELVALGGEIKWSLFEGYREGVRGGLPDFAVRGTVNRVIGQTDVDMTLIGVDGSISYPIGIAGVVSVEPYAGYQLMWTIIRTEPIALFNRNGKLVEAEADRYDAAESLLSGPNLRRHKIFGGFVFRYELLAITMDWTVGLPTSWTTEQYDGFPLARTEKVTVKTSTQLAFSFGAGVQF